MRVALAEDLDELDPGLGRRGKVPWSQKVLNNIGPEPGLCYEAWCTWVEDWLQPISSAVTEVEDGEHLSSLLDTPHPERYLLVMLDLRSTKRQIFEKLGEMLDSDFRRRSSIGRPTGSGTAWVDYAPNGHVDVEALRSALFVYRLMLRSKRAGKRLTNEQLWQLMDRRKRLRADRSLSLSKRRTRRSGRGSSSAAPDEDVQRSTIARQLSRARSVIRAVGQGQFPVEGREQSKGAD